MLLFTSCEHRELVDRENGPYSRRVRVYLEENIRNVSFGFYNDALPKPAYRTPEVMRVVLCDPVSGDVVSDSYLREKGTDKRGNYLEGTVWVEPGHYRLLAYNFDTESVHVENKYDFSSMYAYTNAISEELYRRLGSVRSRSDVNDWRIVYEPDHFFVENGESVTVSEYTDTLRTEAGTHFMAVSTVKSYYLQVQVTGAEFVSSAVALLSGMAGSVQIHDGKMRAEDPVAIHFDLQNGTDRDDMEKIVAYATFHTFGKLEEEDNYLSITFEFKTKTGNVITETIPLTELFNTNMVRENQWIIIDKVIVIPPPGGEEGGGMAPDVDEWDNVGGDIYL